MSRQNPESYFVRDVIMDSTDPSKGLVPSWDKDGGAIDSRLSPDVIPAEEGEELRPLELVYTMSDGASVQMFDGAAPIAKTIGLIGFFRDQFDRAEFEDALVARTRLQPEAGRATLVSGPVSSYNDKTGRYVAQYRFQVRV